MEVLGRDGFYRSELVDPGVINENVKLAVSLLGFREEFTDFRLLGDVGPDSDGFAALCFDVGDDAVRALFTAGIVDDYLCAFCGKMLRNRCANAFGCARNDGDFSFEFAHGLLSFSRSTRYFDNRLIDVTVEGKI